MAEKLGGAAESDKGMPQVGMVFKDREEAWHFWLAYGARVGFDVRKRYTNKSKMDGKVTSCRYVCVKEGLRKKRQREFIQKCFRPETRGVASWRPYKAVAQS
jgi:zinc finger SWIM domain-containing protein 3